MPFVKLDCGILDSTLWFDSDARNLFITALLMAEPHVLKEATVTFEVNAIKETGFVVPPGWYGFIRAAGPAIIRRAGLDDKAGFAALKRLASPEAESRSPDFEGRRLVRIDGGYLALNFQKYRDKDYGAKERMRLWRQRKKESGYGVTDTGDGVTVTGVTQEEAEEEEYPSLLPSLDPRPEREGGIAPAALPLTAGPKFKTAGRGTSWQATADLIEDLKRCYPNVEVLREMEKAASKIRVGAVTPKTAKGMPKFLHSWMERTQNHAHGGNGASTEPALPRLNLQAESERLALESKRLMPKKENHPK